MTAHQASTCEGRGGQGTMVHLGKVSENARSSPNSSNKAVSFYPELFNSFHNGHENSQRGMLRTLSSKSALGTKNRHKICLFSYSTNSSPMAIPQILLRFLVPLYGFKTVVSLFLVFALPRGKPSKKDGQPCVEHNGLLSTCYTRRCFVVSEVQGIT